jgi:uncharacterized membrane protein
MSGLNSLALAMAAFVGTHLILSHPLRKPLVSRIGEGPFLGLYSLVAAITLVWVVIARRSVDQDIVYWIAPQGAWDGATLVMLLASILLAGSMRGNPAMPDPQPETSATGKARGVFAITRHPMLWSFILWALVHILLWGTAANLIVCVSVIILSLAGAIGQDAKKLSLQRERWLDWMSKTSFFPLAGQISGRVSWRAAMPGWRATLIGALIWLAATWAHAPLGGPFAGIWRWVG